MQPKTGGIARWVRVQSSAQPDKARESRTLPGSPIRFATRQQGEAGFLCRGLVVCRSEAPPPIRLNNRSSCARLIARQSAHATDQWLVVCDAGGESQVTMCGFEQSRPEPPYQARSGLCSLQESATRSYLCGRQFRITFRDDVSWVLSVMIRKRLPSGEMSQLMGPFRMPVSNISVLNNA